MQFVTFLLPITYQSTIFTLDILIVKIVCLYFKIIRGIFDYVTFAINPKMIYYFNM